MKNIIKMILILLLPGCGIILINENNYRNLSDSDKIILKPFDPDIVSRKVDNDQFFIYEINSNDILNCSKKYQFTWVHLWRPFCPNEHCQNLNYLLNTVNAFKSHDIELLLVSESYDLKSIENIVRKSAFDKPIFVLQDAYYGHKIRKNRLKLIADFNSDLPAKTRFGFGEYLFKDSTLIYMGYDLNEHKIDSLIASSLNPTH